MLSDDCFYFSSQQRFRRFHKLDGFKTKSRFGLSLASLGDINLDSYGGKYFKKIFTFLVISLLLYADFVVGAPYDGLNGRGAVYIFHGSEKGVHSKYSQVIYAEEVNVLYGKNVETFGFSVSGGIDLDNNDYPDMAVGAYLSEASFFFK